MVEKRRTRREAAAYVTETYGIRLSPRTLEATPVPYIVANGQALYQVADLDRYARDKIASAARRTGRASPRRSPSSMSKATWLCHCVAA